MAAPGNRTKAAPVSPKMIEAGLRTMEAWKNLPPGELLAEVYRAMAALAPVDKAHTTEPTIPEILKTYERK